MLNFREHTFNQKPETRKIVINNCYGSFCASFRVAIELFRNKYTTNEYYIYKKTNNNSYKKITTTDELENSFFYSNYYIVDKDYGEIISIDKFKNITNKECLDSLAHCCNERENPILIDMIEKFGSEFCSNTKHSRLQIIEIPYDVNYIVQEDDGLEWIAEKHRTWEL